MRCGSHLITTLTSSIHLITGGLLNEVWLTLNNQWFIQEVLLTHLITTLTSSIHLITGGLLNEVWLTLNNQWFIQ